MRWSASREMLLACIVLITKMPATKGCLSLKKQFNAYTFFRKAKKGNELRLLISNLIAEMKMSAINHYAMTLTYYYPFSTHVIK